MTTVVCVLVGFFVLLPDDLAELGSSAFAQQLLIANVYFFQRVDYFDGPADLKPLLHMWSLAVEEQFYLVYPFALVLLHRWARGSMLAVLLSVLLLSLAWGMIELPRDSSAAFFLLQSRSWELLLGALLHWIPPWQAGRRLFGEVLALAGLGCIIAASVLYSKETRFPGAAALLPCMGTALLIQVGRSHRGLTFGLLSFRPLVFVGLISYSLYLVHWPILVYLRYENEVSLSLTTGFAAVVASLLLATVSWWVVEGPARRLGARQSIPRVFASFAMVTLACSGAFALVRLAEGFPARLSPAARAILDGPRVDVSIARSTEEVIEGSLPRFGECGESIDCLLWGDSHAAAIVDAFAGSCESLGLCGAVASRNATAPVLGAWRQGREPETTAWNEAVFEFALRHRVRLVVLAARWGVNVEGEPNEGPGKLLVDASRSDRRPDVAGQVLMDALERTVSSLREAGVAVVVVDQFPLQSTNPRRLMVREIEGGTPSLRRTTRGQHLERQFRVLAAFDRIRGRDGVLVVDPSEAMFEGMTDDAFSILGDAMGSYYVDTNHPSRHGATTLVEPVLSEAMGQVLGLQPIS